jgi:hypothetical protein
MFPRPELTPFLDNKPTNVTIQVLQQKLYANARAIYSTAAAATTTLS